MIEFVYQRLDFMQIMAAHDFLYLCLQLAEIAVVNDVFDFQNGIGLYAEVVEAHA